MRAWGLALCSTPSSSTGLQELKQHQCKPALVCIPRSGDQRSWEFERAKPPGLLARNQFSSLSVSFSVIRQESSRSRIDVSSYPAPMKTSSVFLAKCPSACGAFSGHGPNAEKLTDFPA